MTCPSLAYAKSLTYGRSISSAIFADICRFHLLVRLKFSVWLRTTNFHLSMSWFFLFPLFAPVKNATPVTTVIPPLLFVLI